MTNLCLIRKDENSPTIRRGSIKRDWMDESYKKHAYKCLPVTTANASGWEFVLQKEIRVVWHGGNHIPTITNSDTGGNSITHNGVIIADCNKVGMVDFHLGWIFKTSPGYETWLSGPPNYFIDGASPTNAIIPSYWWPDEVQFNWKINKINEEVVFPKGMPFAFFAVFKNELEQIQVKVENMSDHIEFFKERQAYEEAKSQKHIIKPWTWISGIRTGLNEKGERIGPKYKGLPILQEPKL
jgi:hypothetical protein